MNTALQTRSLLDHERNPEMGNTETLVDRQSEFLEWVSNPTGWKEMLGSFVLPLEYEAFSDRTLPALEGAQHGTKPIREGWESDVFHKDPLEAFMHRVGAKEVTQKYAKWLARKKLINKNKKSGRWFLNRAHYEETCLDIPPNLFYSNIKSMVVVIGDEKTSFPDVQLWVVLERSPETVKLLFADGGTVRVNLVSRGGVSIT